MNNANTAQLDHGALDFYPAPDNPEGIRSGFLYGRVILEPS